MRRHGRTADGEFRRAPRGHGIDDGRFSVHWGVPTRRHERLDAAVRSALPRRGRFAPRFRRRGCNAAIVGGVLEAWSHSRPSMTRQATSGAQLDGFRERSLNRGVNPLIYWTLRALLVPFFLIYLRMQRIGREHLPQQRPAASGVQPPQLPRPVRDRHARTPPGLLLGQARAVREALAGVDPERARRLSGRPRRGRSRRDGHRARDPRARRLRRPLPRGHADAHRAARRIRAAASAASRSRAACRSCRSP